MLVPWHVPCDHHCVMTPLASLAIGVYVVLAPPGPDEARPPSTDAPVRTPATAVIANTYGLNFGAQPIPSGEVSLFLGSTCLDSRPRIAGSHSAIREPSPLESRTTRLAAACSPTATT